MLFFVWFFLGEQGLPTRAFYNLAICSLSLPLIRFSSHVSLVLFFYSRFCLFLRFFVSLRAEIVIECVLSSLSFFLSFFRSFSIFFVVQYGNGLYCILMKNVIPFMDLRLKLSYILLAAYEVSLTVDCGIWFLRVRLGLCFEGSHARGQIANMLIATLVRQFLQGCVQSVQIILVETTGALALVDKASQFVKILRTNKLLIVGSADVYQGAYRGRAISGVERGVVNGVAVDFANVQVILDLCDLVGLDAVGDSPYLFWRGVVMVGELFPV